MNALCKIIKGAYSVIENKKVYTYLKEQISNICGSIFNVSQWHVYERDIKIKEEDTGYSKGKHSSITIKRIAIK